uniref:DNA mismatch repair proteins mutS family domain-containing protein n=1 Tax=Chromera velia CCMP2878 TaxID=1169474 RepID=A0A0G4GKZ8_9ALVE|eukprot:Cvel_22364.t1-p1 / transcript=Cvel_22364.t1 / gene=Cvel_22364 / organism=Chromera_velia_CCMP2878 / gene_product=DNA mismatch repair protein msh-2, putative / transcript_product=DNA mismatch repair protein msh-2, putative / location=Cvel_scaffold2191:5602-16979(+) / protein_length=829 / sequence_SO=supercontig / SO=protein_coding / is_pseudo=false
MEIGTGDVHASLVIKVQASGRSVGLASFDADAKKFLVSQFADNEHYSTLESALLQIRPKTSVWQSPEDPIERKKVRNLVASVSPDESTPQDAKKQSFQVDSLEQDLQRLLSLPSSGASEADSGGGNDRRAVLVRASLLQMEDRPLAKAALSGLIDFLRLLHDESSFEQCELGTIKVSKHVMLDRAAHSALSVMPRKGESGRAPTSLYGLLNKCRTAIGSRRLATWLRQPLVDVTEIERRLDCVELFVRNDFLRQSIQSDHMRKVPDLDRLASKLHRLAAVGEHGSKGSVEALVDTGEGSSSSGSRSCNLEDLAKLYDCLVEAEGLVESAKEALRELTEPGGGDGDGDEDMTPGGEGEETREVKRQAESLNSLVLTGLERTLSSAQKLFQLVEHVLDFDEARRGRYVIKRTMSEELSQVGEAVDRAREAIDEERNRVEDYLCLDGARGRKSEEAQAVRLVKDTVHTFLLRVTKKDQAKVQNEKKQGFQQIKINKGEYLFTTGKLKNLVSDFKAAEREYNSLQKTLVQKALSVAATYWPLVEEVSVSLSTLDVLGAFALAACTGAGEFVRPSFDKERKTLRLLGCRHPLVEMTAAAGEKSGNFIANDVVMDRESSRLQIITGPNMGGKSTYIRQTAVVALLAQTGSFVPCAEATLPVFDQILCRVGASDVQLKGVSTFLNEMVEASCILKSASENSLVIVDELGREIVGVKNRFVTAAVSPSKRSLTFLYEVKDGSADQSYGAHVAEMARMPPVVIEEARRKSAELEEVERVHLRMQQESTGEGQTGDAEEEVSRLKRLGSALEEIFQADQYEDFTSLCKRHRPLIEEVCS